MPEPPAKKTKETVGTSKEVDGDVPSPKEAPAAQELAATESGTDTLAATTQADSAEQSSSRVLGAPWPDAFTTSLAPFLSAAQIEDVKKMFLEGRNPPFVSDAGWSGRPASKANDSGISDAGGVGEEANMNTRKQDQGTRGGGRRDRGGRGGRGGSGGRGGRPVVEDHRKVTSDVRPVLTVGVSHTKGVSYYSLSSPSRHALACIKLYESYLAGSWTPRPT
jgi:tRNA pseudouridine13 synthase